MQNLKIVELWATVEAVEAELHKTEDFAAHDAAFAAYNAEVTKAQELAAKFYNEYTEDERDNGITNARDTAAEYGLYKKHGEKVERSAEFWQCAIDSAQVHRDFN